MMPNWSDEIQTGLAQLEAECNTHKARIAELEAKLDWAQQIVKAQTETSSGVACAEERAAGNGGCGACSWCCSQWRERAEVATAELARVKADSLRVVPDVEAFDIDDLPGWEHIINDLYTYDGRTYINIDDERCYKARLERWETAE